MKFLLILVCILTSASARELTEFGIDLLQTASKKKENTVLSPYSIHQCLSMVAIGARGKTLKEMLDVLPFSEDFTQASDEHLKIGNSLWLDHRFSILPAFQKTLENDFRASIFHLDFNPSKEAAKSMNAWISSKCEKKITNLLSELDIKQSTRIVLINTLYFTGQFLRPFNIELTKEGPFWVDILTPVSTPLMVQTNTFAYCEDEEFQVISMPFKDSKIQLVLFLPKDRQNIRFVDSLTSEQFENFLDNLIYQRVTVTVPKFTCYSRSSLVPLLSDLGLQLPFTQNADFSGIGGQQDLYLSDVLHAVFFDLKETGVTAAAATAATMNVMSGAKIDSPIHFTADHPFLFALVDRETKLPLFLGEFHNP